MSTTSHPYLLTEGSSRLAFPIYLHLVLSQNVGIIVVFLSLLPTFSADSARRESLRPGFPISLHLVQIGNVWKVFALPSMFPYI